MHKITMYEGLRDKIDAEIEAINKKGIDNTNVDNLYKLCMSLKCVDKHLECLEEEAVNEENGYSGNMRYLRDGRSYARGGRYSGGWGITKIPDYNPYSYDNSMGNGWNQGGSVRSYNAQNGNSRTYSRDSAKMKMVQKLETLMDDTMSEKERMAIRECINEINAN